MRLIIIWILFSNYLAVASDWRLVEEFDNTPTWKYSDVESIQCYDSNNCFAIVQHSKADDYGCRIYSSSDGGKIWYLIKTISHETPYILNVNKGVSPHPDYYFILSDDENFLEKSTNGGKTFNTKILDSDNHYPINIAMYDTNIGIVINTNSIYSTTDGWESFERHPKLSNDLVFYSPIFIDSNTIVMNNYAKPPLDTHNHLTFMKYHLKEKTWDTLFYFGAEYKIWLDVLYNMFFINDSLAFACGRQLNDSLPNEHHYDLIYKTTNGGNNWFVVLKDYVYPEIGFINDISFADENNGIAVGFYGKIAMTNNGGDTWFYEPTPNAMENCRKMLVCWAGWTPLIGTSGAGIFRYEGDFFKFPQDTTDVEEKEEIIGIEFHPNPANDEINLTVNSNKGYKKLRIRIYSVLGNVLYERFISSEETIKIPTDRFSQGLYFIKVDGISDNLDVDYSTSIIKSVLIKR